MGGRRAGRVMSAWLAVIVLGSLPVSLPAQESRSEPRAVRPRDAVHLASGLKPQDPKLAETFEGAVTSLREGHEVVILFDGKSVTSLRMHLHREKKTPLEEIDIPGPERQALAERLGVAPSQAPRNYLEYVQHLARAGASVFVNRNAVRLYGLAEAEIHPIAKPISTRQMGEILDRTELCYTYAVR